jgi:catechol 2,3-dioxygenase-like lactoylglutathione lyase family enzyme
MAPSTEASVVSVVVDATDIEPLVGFWKEILGLEEARRFPGFVWLGRLGDGGPRLAFQQVPEAKTVKNRLHLDLTADDPEAFIDRVLALGGTRIADHEIQGFRWTVLGDPAGNEFCVAGTGTG